MNWWIRDTVADSITLYKQNSIMTKCETWTSIKQGLSCSGAFQVFFHCCVDDVIAEALRSEMVTSLLKNSEQLQIST